MPIINEPRIRPASSAEAAEDVASRATEAEREGRWDAAAELYALTFRSALGQGLIERAADALRGQARMRLQQGGHEEAAELVELSLEIAREHGLVHAVARGLNVLGIIHYSQRQWVRAQDLYERALEMAMDMGDDELIGLACLNLGVLANLRGDFSEARCRYLEGIGSFVRSGSTANAMLAYNNLGIASADMQEWMESEVYFRRGIEIAERLRHAPPTGMLYTNLAEPLIHIGELERARSTLDLGENAALRVNDRNTLVDVARFRAMIARLEGDLRRAEAFIIHAIELASTAGLHPELAETQRELAELRLAQGRIAEANEILRAAREAFAALGMEADVAAVKERLSEIGGGYGVASSPRA